MAWLVRDAELHAEVATEARASEIAEDLGRLGGGQLNKARIVNAWLSEDAKRCAENAYPEFAKTAAGNFHTRLLTCRGRGRRSGGGCRRRGSGRGSRSRGRGGSWSGRGFLRGILGRFSVHARRSGRG